MSDEEKNMSFQEFVQHIERRGEARGKAIGEARGEARGAERERQSIMTIAADLLPPERIEQLQSIQDLELLTKAIQAALRERVR
jgi:predicted transposase YdaD